MTCAATSILPEAVLPEAVLAGMGARAAALDAAARFPTEDLAALWAAGVLATPRPPGLPALLRALGRANLSVARVFEAHLNALRLVDRYGDAADRAALAADLRAGRLFGLWVTDPPGAALRWDGRALRGSKGPCSGAGHCARALVTVQTEVGVRMAVVALTGAEPVRPVAGLHGMRAAANGEVALDGAAVLGWPGGPGDYLREPEFSCGAWRGSAAALGALDALAALVAAGLRARGQAAAPLQLARFGDIAIAAGTAAAWVERAAAAAEHGPDPAAQVAVVNLARIAVERACLDAIRHTQQALGLAAFVALHPAERIMRDLATYLRQPAGDAVLLEAASWHLAQA